MVTKRTIGIVAAISLVGAAISGSGVASASPVDNSDAQIIVDNESRAEQTSSAFDSRIASSSDGDLITLLLWGQGQIADEHPEISQDLGFPEEPIALDEQGVERVVSTFIETYPEFSTKWAPAIKSGDPRKVDAGLEGFVADFTEFVETDQIFEDVRSQVGDSGLMKAAGDATVVWNAAAGVNVVAGATAVVVALFVVAAATAIALAGGVVYLDNDESLSSTSVDMNAARSNLVSVLAK